ncbi:MOSC domain-containing protein [Modestobacter sp. I12A-02628]|uniref:MOSC domain-containing protein n=1 Tax=Goekera deserti TaxID=2497753 RepID=A0A7K3WFG8_9ACTN|nr:MOSC N-terminal beta barrel domain-containing protein [Goekera deserti]MPR00100.1 MOSC domain-containing protein [Goekera deserti]NDI49879.1 MOSC domain-containing protein [Goekera deserti]NEL55241.1 MOSC domain-containing protein [Goekera deserti]
MRIAEIWRFPVKSLQGEQVEAGELGAHGLHGDRGWALFDLDTGYGLTARRVPELLFASARLTPVGGVEIELPDGTVTRDDAVLSDWTGRRVALRSTGQPTRRRFENPDDAEDEGGRWHAWDGAGGAFHDSDDVRVSLISTASLGSWDRRRFRANVVLDGAGEDGLVGSRVTLGGAVLDVVRQVSRCVMTTRPQPGGITRDTSVLRAVHREHGGTLAVGALVARPGPIAVGDAVLSPAGAELHAGG